MSAMINRSLDSLSFLSDGVRDALRRRLRELWGLGFIAFATLLGIALATWSVQDPSLSHATNAPVRNLLGITGATVADLLMQLFGLGSLAIVLPIAIWGWRLASHRPLARERFRIPIWILGVILAAGFASSLPRTGSWPLPAGLGGVVGDSLLRVPLYAFGATLSGWAWLVFCLLTGVGAFIALAITSGFAWHGRSDDADNDKPVKVASADSDEKERTSISLGFLVHGFLSLKARIARLLQRRGAAVSMRRDGRARPRSARAEPRFDDSRARCAISSTRPKMHRSRPPTSRTKKTRPRRRPPSARRRPPPRRRPARRAAAISCLRWICWRRRARTAAPRSAKRPCRRTPLRSKACSATSACAARSSMRGPARWSRCTSLSRRPASSRRA